jgi:hypothetical protein
MEDLPEVGNLLRGHRHGDRHQEGHRCRGDLLQVLDTGRHRLDTGHQPRTRVRDIGRYQCHGDLQQEDRRYCGERRRCRVDLRQEGQVRYDMYFQQL